MTKRVSVTTSGKKMKPRIGITVGEATGVGPELALQCVALPEVMQRCRPVLYGNETVVARIAATVGRDVPESVVSVGSLAADTIEPGKFTASTGLASYQAVASAIDDALSKKIDGIVTGPIQKLSLIHI